MQNRSLSDSVIEAVSFLREADVPTSRFGIILGTGSGLLAESIEPTGIFDYESIPNFPASSVIGHKARLVCGKIAGNDVIAMQGRFHLYEGHHPDVATLPIRVMQKLGVEVLFVSNASGGLNPNFASGEIMMIDSHIDLMFRSSTNLNGPVCHARPLSRSDAYDQELIASAMKCARQNQFNLQRGVYAALLGPNYETRAEYRMLRRIGADVAGMSTVPEVCVAASLGMRVLGFSIITNVAKPDILQSTTAEEVIDAAQSAAPHFKVLVTDAIRSLSPD